MPLYLPWATGEQGGSGSLNLRVAHRDSVPKSVHNAGAMMRPVSLPPNAILIPWCELHTGPMGGTFPWRRPEMSVFPPL